jgi:tetrahydromethanopterin S-methyltransferase subunit F
MNSKFDVEEILQRNKINTRRIESSVKTLDYYTQNFFTNDTIVPVVQMGENSRIKKTSNDLNEESKKIDKCDLK